MVLFVHRPEYYHIFEDEKGNNLRGMAQIIIAKHRKGATGDVLLDFKGEFTRFQNPGSSSVKHNDAPDGMVYNSKLNDASDAFDAPFPPPSADDGSPFL